MDHRRLVFGAPRPLWPAIRFALARRCPRCGGAHLFRAYLKPVEACPACGEAWAEVRSDDAAPWLTILVVGHVIGPVVVAMARSGWFETWQMAAILVPATLAMTLAFLPCAKAVLMAAIWALRAPTS